MAPSFKGENPFQPFQPFNRYAPFKPFRAEARSTVQGSKVQGQMQKRELRLFDNSQNFKVITELSMDTEQTPMKSFRCDAFEFRSAIHRRHTAKSIRGAILDNRMVHGKPRRESATHPLGLDYRSTPERPAGAIRFQKGV